jgi:hypothetical protein
MDQTNELFDFLKDPKKKKKIADGMKKLGINNYSINKDYSVDVNESVVIIAKNVEE